MRRSTLRDMDGRILSLTLGVLISLLLGGIPGNQSAWAASGASGAEPLGSPHRIQGASALMRAGDRHLRDLTEFEPLYVQDEILTRGNSKLWWNMDMTASDECDASLGAESSLKFFAYHAQGEGSSFVGGVQRGSARFVKKLPNTNPASAFMVATPTALVRVVPTEEAADFVVEVIDSQRTIVTVLWGKVVVKNIAEELPQTRLLRSCRTVLVEQDKAPLPSSGVSAERLGALISRTTIPGTLPTAIPSCGLAANSEDYVPPVSMPGIPVPTVPIAEPDDSGGGGTVNLAFDWSVGPGPGVPGYPPGGASTQPGNPEPPPNPPNPGDPPKNPPNPGDPPKNPPPQPTPCKSGSDCPKGFTCHGGQCVMVSVKPQNPCKANSDCPKGYVCSGGACVKDQVTGAVPQNPCKANGDCPQGFVCSGGACVKDQVTGAAPQTCKANGDCPKGFVCSGGACVKDKVIGACGPCDKMKSDGTCQKVELKCPAGWYPNNNSCNCEKEVTKWYAPPVLCPWCYANETEWTRPLCSDNSQCPIDWKCVNGECRPALNGNLSQSTDSVGSKSFPLKESGKKDDDSGGRAKLPIHKKPEKSRPETFTLIPLLPPAPGGDKSVVPPKTSQPAPPPLTGAAQATPPQQPDRKPDKPDRPQGPSGTQPVGPPERAKPEIPPQKPWQTVVMPKIDTRLIAVQTKPAATDPDAPYTGGNKLPVTAILGTSLKLGASPATADGLKTPKPGGSIEQNPGSSNGKASAAGNAGKAKPDSQAQKSWQNIIATKIIPGVIPAQTKPAATDPDAAYAGVKKSPAAAIPSPSVKSGAALVPQNGLKTPKPRSSIEQNPGSTNGKASASGVSYQKASSYFGSGSKPSAKTTEVFSKQSQPSQGVSQTLRRDPPKLFPIQASPVTVSNPVQQPAAKWTMPTQQMLRR